MGKVYMRVHREAFSLLFTTGRSFEVDQGLPPGARLLGIEYCADGDHYRLCFEHEHLPHVPMGAPIPCIDVWYKEWKQCRDNDST